MTKRWGRKSWGQRVRQTLLWVLLVVLVSPVILLVIYRELDPPITPLMLIRITQGEGLNKTWVPLAAISPHVPKAVIALEDNTFCEHAGFDWAEVFDALAVYYRGGRLRGASTISMQTTKNLFLWPQRDPIRKVVEAPLTLVLEALWDKQRILEVYLNIVEWGPGIYGIEAASRAHFRKSASRLTRREAALLAAVLPNPRKWSPTRPSSYLRQQVYISGKRVRQLGPMLDCTRPQVAKRRG